MEQSGKLITETHTEKALEGFGFVDESRILGWCWDSLPGSGTVMEQAEEPTWINVAPTMLRGSHSFQQHCPVLPALQTLLLCKEKQGTVFRKTSLKFYTLF